MIVEVWTDGACSRNPGPGGYAAICKFNEKYIAVQGTERESTNQRMEILAVIEGLDKAYNSFDNFNKIIIYSDSAYVCNCMLQKWYLNWRKNGWKNSKKEPVANKELWETLLSIKENIESKNIIIEFIKVKGHSDNKMNEKVDKLAVEAYRRIINDNCD